RPALPGHLEHVDQLDAVFRRHPSSDRPGRRRASAQAIVNNLGVDDTMFRFVKRAVVAGSLIASMAMSVLTAAPAAAAGTATLSFNPTSSSVAVGASFDVPVMLDVEGGTASGDQFGITYDPAVLTLNSSTDGTYFSGYASANACTAFNAAPWTPV